MINPEYQAQRDLWKEAADTHPLLHFKISTLNENWKSVHQHGTNLFDSLRSTLHDTMKEGRTTQSR